MPLELTPATLLLVVGRVKNNVSNVILYLRHNMQTELSYCLNGIFCQY